MPRFCLIASLLGVLLAPPAFGQVFTLKEHGNVVSAVAVAPDGKTFWSGGWDGKVCLGETATGKPLLRLAGHDERVLSWPSRPTDSTWHPVIAMAVSSSGTPRPARNDATSTVTAKR
jgi:WD40 repeat protein